MLRFTFIVCTLVFALPTTAVAYGPCSPTCDYTDPADVRDRLPVVENYHFNADVESLRAGMSSDYVAHDLQYTLNSFPNHHRALHAMARLWRRYLPKGQTPPGAAPGESPKYWFERAIRRAPHDGIVRCIYGLHLYKTGKVNQALELCKQGLLLTPDSAEVHYSLGLFYFVQNDYKLANEHASRAYELGYPLPGLKNKLMAVGAWDRTEGVNKHRSKDQATP
jgi:hypothetical protein